MAINRIRCPHCLYEGSFGMFEIVDSSTLKCRRCRGRFEDPNTFAAGISYADCDSRKVVTRFPFSLNGNNAVIRVRGGYSALLVGNSGRQQWLKPGLHSVNDMPEGCQLYYVCLKPQITWGTHNSGGFGAYGIAQLMLSPDYAENYVRKQDHILSLESHLKYMMDSCVTVYVQRQEADSHQGVLEQRDGYLSVLGILESGVSITEIHPLGYRNSSGKTGAFPFFHTVEEMEEEEKSEVQARLPVESVRLPQEDYIVRTGVEDVLIRNPGKAERHKADEKIDQNMLRGVSKLFRYRSKEFEFPFGWGAGNQVCGAQGFFSANGTISFFIDSTEKLSLLLNRTEGWKNFEEQLFFNVIKPEISTAISGILRQRFGDSPADDTALRDSLSEMSVQLTSRLNGEGGTTKGPVFRQYGLRVRRADILTINVYSVRR